MRRFAPLAAGAVAAALLIAVPTTQAAAGGGPGENSAPTSNYVPPPVSWKKCTGDLGDAGAQCGFLTVPLDYTKPNGQKIKLALSRVKHKVAASKYQGIMLVNPGGPGGSGTYLATLGSSVPKHAGDAYDWIGFDPRGVGESKPTLSCDIHYFSYDRPQYTPYTRKLEKTWLDRSAGYSADCAKAPGAALLDHVKTTDTVQDIDSIRKALGRKQINFYGFSYGSYLGQVYSTWWPEKVRRMVLDGIVNPNRVWYDANLDQDYAFEAGMDVYFGWVAKYHKLYHLGDTAAKVKKAYYKEYAALDKKAAGGIIGPDEFSDVMLTAGYAAYVWPEWTEAFAALVNHGQYKLVKDLYDEAYPQEKGGDNGFAMYLATQCTDVAWPSQWSTWRSDNWQVYRDAPFFTWGNVWFNAPCLTWPAAPGTPVMVDGSNAPPILLINETKDGATPYSGALKVRNLFPRSVLIEGVNGTTHAGSLNGVACTDNKVAAFLASGTLPAWNGGPGSDVQCPPVPQPDPTAKTAAASSSGASRAVFR